jgi:hypothetical protein
MRVTSEHFAPDRTSLPILLDPKAWRGQLVSSGTIAFAGVAALIVTSRAAFADSTINWTLVALALFILITAGVALWMLYLSILLQHVELHLDKVTQRALGIENTLLWSNADTIAFGSDDVSIQGPGTNIVLSRAMVRNFEEVSDFLRARAAEQRDG